MSLNKITHRHSDKESFRHVRHDDGDEEDHGSDQLVPEPQRDEEDEEAQEDGHPRDDVDEVLDLLRNGCFPGLETGCQGRDAAHDRVVPSLDHYSHR